MARPALMVSRTESAVIAVQPETVAKRPPPLVAAAVAQGDVVPSPILDLLVSNGFRAARQAERHLIQRGVLRVRMMNGIAKGINGGQRVGAHPEKVARVQISPDDRPNLLSQSQQCRSR
jgi:hypothetical protein